jgi:hypothetical protein
MSRAETDANNAIKYAANDLRAANAADATTRTKRGDIRNAIARLMEAANALETSIALSEARQTITSVTEFAAAK